MESISTMNYRNNYHPHPYHHPTNYIPPGNLPNYFHTSAPMISNNICLIVNPILSQNLLFIKDRLQYKTNGFYYLFSLCDHHFIFTRWISVGGRQLAINGHAVCNTHSLLLLIMIPSTSTLMMVIKLDALCTCIYLYRLAKFIMNHNSSNKCYFVTAII